MKPEIYTSTSLWLETDIYLTWPFNTIPHLVERFCLLGFLQSFLWKPGFWLLTSLSHLQQIPRSQFLFFTYFTGYFSQLSTFSLHWPEFKRCLPCIILELLKFPVLREDDNSEVVFFEVDLHSHHTRVSNSVTNVLMSTFGKFVVSCYSSYNSPYFVFFLLSIVKFIKYSILHTLKNFFCC